MLSLLGFLSLTLLAPQQPAPRSVLLSEDLRAISTAGEQRRDRLSALLTRRHKALIVFSPPRTPKAVASGDIQALEYQVRLLSAPRLAVPSSRAR